MFTVYERNTLTALLILDLEDAFARSRGRPGEHPRPLEPLRFFLTERVVQGTITKYESPMEVELIRNSSGYHLFFGRQKIRGAQRANSTQRLDLPPGKYTLRVTSPLYQTTTATLDLPIGNANDPNILRNYRLDLQASYAYPFPDITPLGQQSAGNCSNGNFTPRRGPTLLRGVVLNEAGQGVENASIRVATRTNTYTTDSTGQWVLWFKEPVTTGPVDLLIKLPNRPNEQTVNNVCVVQGHETSLHQTALRGWVRRGARPLPGAVINAQGFPGQAVSDQHGGWTLTFPFDQGARAVTLTARVQGFPEQTRTVNLAPRASIVVNTFQF